MARTAPFVQLSALLVLPLAAAALSLATFAQPPAAAAAAEPAGKQVFLAKKCNLCHSIDSQGIARTSKSEKTKGPDLSNVGSVHLAPWMMQFLQREIATAEGKKHTKPWSGTEQELKQLTDWLATLKKA